MTKIQDDSLLENTVECDSTHPPATSASVPRLNYSGVPSENLTPAEVIDDVIACAQSWEPGVRLLGNVRAVDIVRALWHARALLASRDAAPTRVAEGHHPEREPLSKAR